MDRVRGGDVEREDRQMEWVGRGIAGLEDVCAGVRVGVKVELRGSQRASVVNNPVDEGRRTDFCVW